MISANFIRSRAAFSLPAMAAAVALLGAFIAQYGLGLAPCHLCLLQRVPHALAMVVALCGWIYLSDKYRKYMWIVLATLFLVGVAIAVRHVGVESGWWGASCVATIPEGASLEDIRARIQAAPRVSCDQAMAYVFGLSMAAWNAIYSMAWAVFALYCARRA